MRRHEHSFEDGDLEEVSRRIVAISPDNEFFESYDDIDRVVELLGARNKKSELRFYARCRGRGFKVCKSYRGTMASQMVNHGHLNSTKTLQYYAHEVGLETARIELLLIHKKAEINLTKSSHVF